MNAVELKKLSYTYPGENAPALRDVSLRIDAGQFISVIGASGSGKTTLLNCISGFIPYDIGGRFSGNVRLFGTDMNGKGLDEHLRHVGMVFQNPHLQQFSDSPVEELAFPLENMNILRDEMIARIKRIVRQMGLKHLMNRRINEMSGGEKQLLAIATALIRRPDILILDEPTSELDPENTRRIKKILLSLRGKLTVILAEHRFELLEISDRILGIGDGGIMLDGYPERVLSSENLAELGLDAPPEVLAREKIGPGWRELLEVGPSC